MLQDVIVVDNVFDNPDSVVEFANRQTFLTKEQHINSVNINWVGSRSKELYSGHSDLTIQYVNRIMFSCIEHNKFNRNQLNHQWQWSGTF